MKCPKCGHDQYCPCKSCKDRLPKDKKAWVWINGDEIKCANCDLTMHADGWLEEERKQFKESEK